MKIEIKNRYTDEVIFSHECGNNTIKKTVLEAVKQNAYLRNANLSDANLRNADLSDADLRNADLSDANLRNANLSYADLRNANLSDANLRNADLRNADLRNAYLRNAYLRNASGNCRQIKTIQTDIWHVCMTKDFMQIGCEQHSVEDWKNFTDERISKMESRALDFWTNWKKVLVKIHKKGFSEEYK